MTVFHIGNSFTVVDDPAPLAAAISRYLTIKKDSFIQSIDQDEYRLTGKTVLKTVYKPQIVPLYNHIRRCFPTGRLGYITDWMWDNQIPFQISDERVKPEPHLDVTYVGPPSDGSNGLPARPYQLDAAILLKSKGGRGVFHDATASGKTCTAARLISDLRVNTLYMVPSIELLNQTAEALGNMLKIKGGIGVIGEGEWNPKAITVATAATLWSRYDTEPCKKLLAETEFFIGDEIHHVQIKERGRSKKTAKGELIDVNSWYVVALNCAAYYRAGMTGTPGKDIEQKRALLECAIGRVLRHVSARELIDAGIISDVEIHMHTIKCSQKFGDYHTAIKENVLLNEKFNEYLVSVAIAELKQGKSVLMLTGSKMHQGPLLQRVFSRYGMEVPFISGDSGKKDRKAARVDFKAGAQKILIGTIYKEGVDFPALDVGILCDGSKDEKKTLQFLGRVLRTSKGKGIAHLHDFKMMDKGILQKHSHLRLNYFLEEELDKIITHPGISI